ncbi:MAG: 50S ribosomal protein L25 [Verrucomicrobiota bacterium]
MSERINLTASRREKAGRGGVRKLRAAGKVPAVLYGAGEPASLELDTVAFIDAIHEAESDNVLVNLSIDGDSTKSHLALIQEIQHHPIKDTVLHIDFHEVRQDQTIQANVPIHEEGTATGVKNGGGILDHCIRELHVECLPNDLPAHISVDVSSLELEQAIHVNELDLPQGVTALNDGELPVFMVHPPRVKEDVTEDTEATAGEPEIIGEKKEEAAPAD